VLASEGSNAWSRRLLGNLRSAESRGTTLPRRTPAIVVNPESKELPQPTTDPRSPILHLDRKPILHLDRKGRKPS
jgi:hypothetical protein